MTETGTKDVRAAGRSGAVDREALVRAALDEGQFTAFREQYSAQLDRRL